MKIIKFYGPHCPQCNIVSENLNSLKEEFEDRIDFQEIEANAENNEWYNKYDVRAIPTVILMKGGTEIDRWVGIFPLELLKEKLDG